MALIKANFAPQLKWLALAWAKDQHMGKFCRLVLSNELGLIGQKCEVCGKLKPPSLPFAKTPSDFIGGLCPSCYEWLNSVAKTSVEETIATEVTKATNGAQVQL